MKVSQARMSLVQKAKERLKAPTTLGYSAPEQS